jgi:hypothetical protein
MIGTIGEAKAKAKSDPPAAPAKPESKPAAKPNSKPAAGFRAKPTPEPQPKLGVKPQPKIEHAADTHES